MNANLHILIVEDEPLIAEDIHGLLFNEGYSNVDIVYDVDEALVKLETNKYEFLLLDINLGKELNGIELAKRVNKDYQLPFVFITSYADAATINEVKITHPVGYIVKPFNEKEIPAIIEIGLELFYTYMGPPSIFDVAKLNKLASEEFTQKETEVLLKLGEGKSNKQIADELFVSVNTIKTHLKNIFVKLNISSRSEAVVLLTSAKKK